MASSGLALTALLVFAAMSAVLANPYPYPGRNYQYPMKNAEKQQFPLESAEEQQFPLESAEEQQQQNWGEQTHQQYIPMNAEEQYWPPMALVDLQGVSANAMYNGMESALAMQELAGTQQACLLNLNIPIAFVGNLNIQVCPKATNAGCDRVSVTLGRIVNTRVVVCDKGAGPCVDVAASVNDCSKVFFPLVNVPVRLPRGGFVHVRVQIFPPAVCVKVSIPRC